MLKLHHIGLLTDCIEKTGDEFRKLGYFVDEVVHDDIQKTHICFLRNSNAIILELVEPYEDNKTMSKMVAKRGVSPYHLCYEVEDILSEYDNFVKLGYTPLFKPVPAIAMNNKLICYFWKSEIGFIELVNK